MASFLLLLPSYPKQVGHYSSLHYTQSLYFTMIWIQKNSCLWKCLFQKFWQEKMTWFITWIIAKHYHLLSFKNRIMRELVVRAQATHYLFHRKGEKSILLPPKNKVEKKQWNLQIVGKLLLFQWHIFTSEVGKWRGFSLARGGKSS